MGQEFHIMQAGYTICPENWGMVNESVLFYRVYYVYGGAAWVCRNNEIHALQKGCLYLFPVMSQYTMWHDPSKPLDVLWFHVEMSMGAFADYPCLHVKKNSLIWHILESMREIVNDAEYTEELTQLFLVFVSVLSREIPFKKAVNHKMKNVLSYMENHIEEGVQIQQLASSVGMERSYFSRKFKETYKMSPMQYLMAMKMSFAARELLKGASVYQAAIRVGYVDEKAFSRAFKNYMEISPSQYRKSHILQP